MTRKQFAEECFEAFAPFINVFDPGEKAWWGDDTVYHTITKDDWKYYRRWKAGEYVPGFSAQKDVALKTYKPWHVEQHIFKNRPSYYTSGNRGQGLLYQDIDAHHIWQTDQERARELLESKFPFGFFRKSARGENGYLKTRYTVASNFNKTATRMQDVIQRWFLYNEILCDFEIKGTITTKDKSGDLAKLPFHSRYEERMLLEKRWPWWEEQLLETCDDWCYYKLEEFKQKEIIGTACINRILDQLEAEIDEEKVRKFAAHKEIVKAQYEADENTVTDIVSLNTQPESRQIETPKSNKEAQESALSSLRSEKDGSLGRAINCDLEPDGLIPSNNRTGLTEIREITNAHTRRHKFAWWFSCRLRRVATVEESLAAYREHQCYRGEWEDGLNKRTANFCDILSYIANIFDSDKCGSRQSELPQLDELIRECFGIARYHLIQSGSVSLKINMRQWADENGQPHQTSGRNRIIDRKHAHYLHAIIRYSVAAYDDGAIPLKTMQDCWEKLSEVGNLPVWNYDYYLACRKYLENLGWIKVSGIWSKPAHIAQTCKITYSRKKPAYSRYTYPSVKILNVSFISITMITQSVSKNIESHQNSDLRPPPRGQPPPDSPFFSSFEEQNSWN